MSLSKPVVIGSYLVSHDAETFRIFPKNRAGETVPVTRFNYFLYLRCTFSGQLVTFKRYLHQKNWFWRDSRDAKPTDDRSVQKEVARMLFKGDEGKAGLLLTSMLTGGDVSSLAA
jgi:hypothetical protein